MADVFSLEALAALAALTSLEVVLGIDNIEADARRLCAKLYLTI